MMAVPSDDEDFEVSYERAKTLEASVTAYISDVKGRIFKIDEEVQWLQDNPTSELWQDLKNRITKFSKEELSSSAVPYKYYLEMTKERRRMVEGEVRDIDWASASLQVSKSLLKEFIDEELTGLVKELTNIRTITSSIVDSVIIGSVCQDGSFRIDKEDVTGKSNLYVGTMNDIRRDLYGFKCSNLKGAPSYDVKRTQQVVNSLNRNSSPCDSWKAVPVSVIHLMDAIREYSYDRSKMKPLVQVEKRYWKKVLLNKVATLVSPSIDYLVCLKVFPRKVVKASLIVAGSSSGRLAVWVAPWSNSEPYLAAVTAELPKRERGPVVDIREGIINNIHIVYLLGNGHVRVWSLNQIPKPSTKKATHTSSLFPPDKAAFIPQSMSSLFHMSPADMNLPVSTNATVIQAMMEREKVKGAKKGDKKTVNLATDSFGMQEGFKPTSVSFHPSLSLLGHNNAILVGSDGGDIIKFNMDTKNTSLDAPVVYLPPFIDREFTHPANAKSNVVVARALPNTKGNMVSREVFHFHKSRVVLIDIVGKTSNRILTIDETGTLAIWRYDPLFFEEKFWFRPETTITLDLSRVEYENASELEPVPVPVALIEKKKLRSRLIDRDDSKGTIAEEYHPVKGGIGEGEVVYMVITQINGINPPITNQSISPMKGMGVGDGQSLSPPIKWFCKKVVAVKYFARFDQVRTSTDGTQVFFLVSYSTDSKSDKSSNSKRFMSVIGFDIDKLRFDPPFVKFNIDPRDSVVGFHIGPITSETLTRFAFIHTKSQVRVISLETASEVINDTIPFKTRGPQNFSPLLSALCPSQRLLAFGSVDDTRIVLYDLLCKTDSDTADTFLTREAMDAIRSDPQSLQRLAISTRGGLYSSDSHFNRFERSAVDQFVLDIVMGCFEAASNIIEVKMAKKLKEDYLRGFYGASDTLGVVKPTAWPDPDAIGDDNMKLINDERLSEYKQFLEKRG